MRKVKCSVCLNEVGGFCKIKKDSVKLNKPRRCDAFIYDKTKVVTREAPPVTRVSYTEMEANRKRLKAELKELRRMLKEKPKQGTAKDLGLIPSNVDPGYRKDSSGLIVPVDTKYPLTGDLSRFITTASNVDKEESNEDQVS